MFAFILVFMKKWEPGGNIDAIWYEAIAKNIATTGDFFHFFVSRNVEIVWDHMPMTYWIVGGIMRLFGVSDFIARLYPMACSYASCLLVYACARRMRGATFGLLALVSYALCLGAMKWNGSLMQDVPLTTFFLGAYYSLLRARSQPRWLCGAALFVSLGVLTKGPIIFGFAGAAFVWIAWEHRWNLLRTRWFLASVAVVGLLLGSLYLPSLRFDGHAYYDLFWEAKRSYGAPSTGGWRRHFAYVQVLWTGAFLMIPFALASLPALFGGRDRLDDGKGRSELRLALLIVFSVAVPLSFFAVKYPHYMLPVYPFVALLAASCLERLIPPAWLSDFPTAVRTVAVATAFFFVSTPLKITGQRSKEALNLVNSIKLDSQIRSKDVVFVGRFKDDMSVLQAFKLYGSIDLSLRDPTWAAMADLSRTWLIIPFGRLPLSRAVGVPLTERDCLFRNGVHCAITQREGLSFDLPTDRYPHEIY